MFIYHDLQQHDSFSDDSCLKQNTNYLTLHCNTKLLMLPCFDVELVLYHQLNTHNLKRCNCDDVTEKKEKRFDMDS